MKGLVRTGRDAVVGLSAVEATMMKGERRGRDMKMENKRVSEKTKAVQIM